LLHNLTNLIRYRGLIQSLVARDLKARYRGSALGFFWTFVNPLLLLLVYSFVFTTVMPNNVQGVQPYALFMFCGILPWTWFSSSLSEASGSLIAGGNLIKKVLFPAEILPIVSVLANLVNYLLGLLILIPCLIYYHRLHMSLNLLWFPVTMIVQLVFTTALALALAALTVHFRDIRDLLANVRRFRPLFDANPFTHLAISYQEILFYGPVGHWKWLLLLGAASVALFVAGFWLFDRLRDSFAEAV
jgi:ABC-type polysaccharide/polyol phosphate export permease